MTNAQITTLINNARLNGNDPVEWTAELKPILNAMLGQFKLNDLTPTTTGQVPTWNQSTGAWGLSIPSGGGGGLVVTGTPATGQIPKWNGTTTVWANDDTASGGTGWDSNGTLTANRAVTMDNKTITLRNLSPNANPGLEFHTTLTTNNIITHWRVKSPTDDPFCPDFGLLTVATQNATAIPANPDSYNEVAKLGFNPDRAWASGRNGFWDAWEPHWLSGDALYLERHISVDAKDFPGENRLYSILTILRTSWATSDIIHLWRGSSYNWKTTTGEDLLTMAKNGTSGMKFTMIGPGSAAMIYEVGGTLGNGVSMYMFDNGGTMDLLNDKWARWYFRNTKLNIALPTYASNAAALGAGLLVNDLYKDSSGNVKIVI
jgi:hypothetical protein